MTLVCCLPDHISVYPSISAPSSEPSRVQKAYLPQLMLAFHLIHKLCYHEKCKCKWCFSFKWCVWSQSLCLLVKFIQESFFSERSYICQATLISKIHSNSKSLIKSLYYQYIYRVITMSILYLCYK